MPHYKLDGIEQINSKQLKEIWEDPDSDMNLIDVREVHEYVAGHIPGVPLIPMMTIPQHVSQMDKQKAYVFICRSGQRSQQVALYLKSLGFSKVYNYIDGMIGWEGDIAYGED